MSESTDKNHGDGKSHGDAKAPKLGLKTRLVAWWEGYDLSGLRRKGDEGAHHDGGDGDAAPRSRDPSLNRWGKPLWSATRMEVAETLWGANYTTPGGADYVPTLIRPLGLNPAMSVLELGAGLGGISRFMAAQSGCWVTGLEANPALAKEAMERSYKEGLEKKAPIEHFDPETFARSKRVDAIVSKEMLFTVRDKDRLFDAMEAALKPRGHLLLTDYVLDTATDVKAIRDWADREPLEPNLWTTEDMRNAFAQRNLDLRICEDITEAHRGLILHAIQNFVTYLTKYSLDKETKVAVLDEVELWVRRTTAFDAGLKCCRFYALKPAE